MYDFTKQKDESPRHYRYKWRLFRILLLTGCYPLGLERGYRCSIQGLSKPIRHMVDVHGTMGVCREINCEVNGPKNHTTTRAYNKDQAKAKRIKEQHGEHIETYALTFKQIAAWTDEEIAEEMRLYYYP